MTAPIADDDPIRAAEQAAQDWADYQRYDFYRHAADPASARMRFLADRHGALMYRDVVAAAAELDDPDEHARILDRLRERVADLALTDEGVDVLTNVIASEMWPSAFVEARDAVKALDRRLAELSTAAYQGRRRMCECQTPTYDGWGCSTCGGRIVQSGGVA